MSTDEALADEGGGLKLSTWRSGNATWQWSGTDNAAGESTVVNRKVDGQNMPAKDLEGFLPALGIHMPSGATIQGGTLSTNLNLVGPTTNLVTAGNVGIFNVKLAGFDLGSKLAALGAVMGLKTGKDRDIEKDTTNWGKAPGGRTAGELGGGTGRQGAGAGAVGRARLSAPGPGAATLSARSPGTIRAKSIKLARRPTGSTIASEA